MNIACSDFAVTHASPRAVRLSAMLEWGRQKWRTHRQAARAARAAGDRASAAREIDGMAHAAGWIEECKRMLSEAGAWS
ncbi:MAG: hypothetical protein AB1918_14965 [Pseudomonadota bacterium]